MSVSMTRRDFIKTMGVAGGAALIGGATFGTAEAAENSTADAALRGVCDIHIHCAPDTRPRCTSELDLARRAKAAGCRALMFKSNDWSCHDRAYIIREAVPGFEVFGSICMNRVHGDRVNVYAAEQAVKTDGGLCRCIWMPTLAAEYPLRGAVLPEVVRVMEICAEADIIFATGHSSPEESLTLAAKANEVGVRKFVVTHVNSLMWKMTREQIERVVELDGYVEYCYLPRLWGPGTGNPDFERQSAEEFLNYVKTAPERSFISTDLGQRGNPDPLDGMKTCIEELAAAGVPQRDIDLMVRTNPAHLIGLE